MTSTPWQISADTGGTFTDCYGIPPGGGPAQARLVKVLSSGKLRVAAEAGEDRSFVRICLPKGWHAPPGFFTGFTASAGEESIPVTGWDPAASALRLERSWPVPVPQAIDLETGEEAPVLGARLLTGTAPGQPFPPLEFRLGTTRGTNALLERKGAPVAWFVTRGFADLLLIRDQRRPDLFALEHLRPPPLCQRVIEVDERLAADGAVLLPLGDSFEAPAREALDAGIRVAAVSLLHGYRDPAHEQALGRRLLELGFSHVSLSSGLAPLIKLLPRAETAVVDATLTPVMQGFLDRVAASLGESATLLAMTSAGGLETAAAYRPKDSLLSGPAGGVVGAAAAARALGQERIITFDMGGTSTDVARCEGDYLYRFEQQVGDARLLAPALRVETVAAGGGSVCRWTPAGLRVGPESAGAEPGPACYGRDGPLTITDVNLLLGRIDPANFGIPVGEDNIRAARGRAAELAAEASQAPGEAFLLGLLEIAVEQMADAIRSISLREGADPAGHVLVAFGGAGPLHACDIAERLGMSRVLAPREAGLLSAFGIHHAAVERFAERQVLAPWDETARHLPGMLDELAAEARASIQRDLGDQSGPLETRRRLAEVRLLGQDAALSVELGDPARLDRDFRLCYESVFGYQPDPALRLELVALRVIVSTPARQPPASACPRPAAGLTGSGGALDPVARAGEPSSAAGNTLFLDRAGLAPGQRVAGPRVIQDPFSTLYLKPGWTAAVADNGALLLDRSPVPAAPRPRREASDSPVTRELFRHRFEHLAEEMGAMLQRSAISTNVKERADFSCALLDAGGQLVVNAPHIPVHLGALGLCVREVARVLPLAPGDTAITNHPGYGGSHLPDVTLVTPVHAPGDGALIGYVANRAHHAEIGGISPGSMPPGAVSLAEEGVVIPPLWLARAGESRFKQIARILSEGSPWPTRRLADNLADLHAQLAANLRGAALLSRLAADHGSRAVRDHLEGLARQARASLREHLDASGFTRGEAEERLDDGALIRCLVTRQDDRLRVDFTGTAQRHRGNLNATPAIIRSAVLYALRLWTRSEAPLNEGLLRDVAIVLPRCFLNPEFPSNLAACPAVVGGNVETSQRVVDALISALGFQAGSQGTMNNFLFGDARGGYYETIGGGAGAGAGYRGASGLHTHMTNTAITDPEILEHRYPVRLRRFSLRPGSGGAGAWPGGDGLIREVEFLAPLQVSLLTQHRVEEPRGKEGGCPGARGRQTLARAGSTDPPEVLPGITSFEALPGDILRIETPGGGGWGAPG